MSELQKKHKDPTFFCHFAGGGLNIIVSTVMADFLKFLVGYGNFCDYFDYFSGVSSGAIVISAALVPKERGSSEPLHKDFKYIRHQVLYANDDFFDKIIAQRFIRRQIVGDLVSSWPDWFKKSRGMSPLFNWLTDPNRLHFSSENVEDMIKKVMGRPRVTLNDLLRPFVCPSIHVQGRYGYHFHTNQKLSDRFDSSPVNERLLTALLATSRLVPLLRPDEENLKIDGGSLFSGIEAAKILGRSFLQSSNITVLNCMDATEWVVGLEHLQSRPDKAAYAVALAERRASRDLEETFFSDEYPHAKHQVFSRLIKDDVLLPYGGPIARLMSNFCEEYCYRSYQEVLQTPPSPINLLKSVMTPDRNIHTQMVNQAIRACVAQLPQMVELSKHIIHGPLARNCGLNLHQQDELIATLDARIHPASHPNYPYQKSKSTWGFPDFEIAR